MSVVRIDASAQSYDVLSWRKSGNPAGASSGFFAMQALLVYIRSLKPEGSP
jgi:hypothetical protein